MKDDSIIYWIPVITRGLVLVGIYRLLRWTGQW